MSHGVPIHCADELEMARRAGRLAAEVLGMIEAHVVPGVSTQTLDQICHDHIVNVQDAIPANLGYHGYPKTILTSVNQVVCHGIPSATKILKKGDIVNIDVAVLKDGWFGDTSRMFFVGTPSVLARRLVETTYEALLAGIRQVKPGATLGDIGHAIQSVAQAARFSVVREYCGQGVKLEAGMVFTIEPMLNAGQRETKQLPDKWTVVTKDRSLSAQFEHMVAVTPSGYEVLTSWPGGTGAYAPV
ncbi:MAG: methionyl aminopeptidase [Comamonadaceae bacterium]|nr:MAG: methionyl aminopeptidase [Comamonadaceae bacterium]